MVQAYILIQTEVGKAAEVAATLQELPGVTHAEDITGPYDVIVRAEAADMDQLTSLVTARMHPVPGLTRTHHLPGGAPLRRLVLAVLTVALAASACGQPVVEVGDVPAPDGQEAQECAQLTADLPNKVGNGLEKRDVKPNSPLLAAWGKPAAVLRCGVGIPATYRPGTDLTIVNNIGWFGDDRADDVVYTTITRRAPGRGGDPEGAAVELRGARRPVPRAGQAHAGAGSDAAVSSSGTKTR